jgi:hypothetical protein
MSQPPNHESNETFSDIDLIIHGSWVVLVTWGAFSGMLGIAWLMGDRWFVHLKRKLYHDVDRHKFEIIATTAEMQTLLDSLQKDVASMKLMGRKPATTSGQLPGS